MTLLCCDLLEDDIFTVLLLLYNFIILRKYYGPQKTAYCMAISFSRSWIDFLIWGLEVIVILWSNETVVEITWGQNIYDGAVNCNSLHIDSW